MAILGYILALFIGITLGLIGSGGSILSVPILSYCFQLSALEATTMSLFVVAITSWIGSISYFKNGWVHLGKATAFGIPSVIAIVLVRRLLLPIIPEVVFTNDSFTIHRDTALMILFAILMLISAIKMIRNAPPPLRDKKSTDVQIALQGFVIGIITGLLGAGGGFLIIPALVLLLRMDMKQAVGTSLFLVALNTSVGFASNMELIEIQWNILLIFTTISIIGILVGLYLSKKIEGAVLKPLFGWFVLLIGIFIISKELFFK